MRPGCWEQPRTQAERARAEQQPGIDVARGEAGAEVEPLARGAQPITRADRASYGDLDRRQQRVGGAQPAAVRDGHVQGAADLAGERNGAVTRGEHRLADRRRVLPPAVAGAVARGRRTPAVDDLAVDRRAEPAG
jgi:hypothetical protein